MTTRRPSVLSVADVADIVAYATAKYSEVALERLPFAKAERDNVRVTTRNVERREAALLAACVAGAISLTDLDSASSPADIAAVEARLDTFIEERAARRRPRSRLRVVASQRPSALPERSGERAELRIVPPSKPTGRGR